MIKRLFFRSLYAILSLALVACQGGERTHVPAEENLQLKYAQLITDEELALIGGDYQRVAVDASVYKGLMEMLGVGDKCIDFSDQMKPDVEKIAASKADLLLVSAYEGADLKKYERLGIPVVHCRDFLETTALGRAEWMRYLGRLWGVAEQADSLFSVIEDAISPLDALQDNESRPAFLFDTIYGAVWYQPSPESTIGQLVTMAGGTIPFRSEQKGGSLALSKEEVLLNARDADYWIVRYMGKEDMTLDDLARINPIYAEFQAFKEGRVFGCNTSKVPFYDETPFRPDWLLDDFKHIIDGNNDSLRYFKKIY